MNPLLDGVFKVDLRSHPIFLLLDPSRSHDKNGVMGAEIGTIDKRFYLLCLMIPAIAPSLLTPIPPEPQKPLFIYFPGMDGAGTLFYRQIPYLAPWFDIRCFAIPTSDLSSWQQLVTRAIASINENLDPKHPREIYFCGESFGGCLALKIAEKAPQLSTKLILINPATSFAQQSLLGWGVGLTAWVPDWFYRGTTWGFLPLLTSPHRIPLSDRANLLKAMQALSPGVVSWRLSLLLSFKVDRDRLRNPSPKTLILASGLDRLQPSLAEARRLQNLLPQAQIHLLPASGHSCLLERDLNLAQILKKNDFLPQPSLSSIV